MCLNPHATKLGSMPIDRRSSPSYFARTIGRFVTAALFLCAFGAAALWYRAAPHRTPAARDRGGTRYDVSALPDGSAIRLADNTTVAVTFGTGERRLKMSSGEAFFKVRPDKQRPFVVRAGPIDVTAVGTAFDVKAEEGHITVLGQEGVVTVAPVKGASSKQTHW
jgi:transmembrane sensor